MKVFAVVLQINGARWLDSQFVDRKAAEERQAQVVNSFNATNQTCYSLDAKVIPFRIEDARLV